MIPKAPLESLPKALGIKAGHTVILHNVPASIVVTLGSQVRQAFIQQTAGTNADMLICFATDEKELDAAFETLKNQIATHGALWILWPKIIAGIKTDLKRSIVHDIGTAHGLSEVNACEIEHMYGGLKFVYKLQDR